MTKNELIKEIAKEVDVTIDEAKKCLDAFTKTITESLKKKQSVTLVGFGTFTTKKRTAREGRNPKTGEALKVPAVTLTSFKAGKTLKEAVKIQPKPKTVSKKNKNNNSLDSKSKSKKKVKN